MTNVYITIKDGKSQLIVDGSLDLFGEFICKMRSAIRAGDIAPADSAHAQLKPTPQTVARTAEACNAHQPA